MTDLLALILIIMLAMASFTDDGLTVQVNDKEYKIKIGQ